MFTLPSTVAEILKTEDAYRAQDGFISQMELQGHVTLLNKGEEEDHYFPNFLPIVGRNGEENTLFVGHVFLPKKYWKLVRPTGPGLLRLSEQEEPSETIETYIKEKKAERKPKK